MDQVFLNRCRACANKSSEKMIFLFENNIFKLFSTCTSLTIATNDSLPAHLCVQCFEDLTYFNKFREKCATSDLIFRQEIEARLELVKIESVEEIGFKYEPDPDPPNDSGDEESESEFYETEYIDEAFTKYDPDRKELNSIRIDSISDRVSDSIEGEQYICDYCGQRFEKKNHIASHMIKHKEIVPKIKSSNYSCTVEGCQKVFAKRKSLTSHRTNVHKIKAEPRAVKIVGEKKIKIFCQKCPKWFTIQLKLDAHIRREGLKPYQCTHCEKEFCKNRSYAHHMRVRHSDIKIEKFPCTYIGCNREYELQDSLKVHINRYHLGKVPPPRNQKLICEQCGRTFKNGFNLKEHSYSHSGILPFCCTICPKKFISNYKLKIHTMRHLNIKNFVCPTCGLRKTTNKELQAHLNFHSKEITYPCKECSRVFASYSAINRHVRIHHRNHKPYICPHCQRAFAKAETMKNHVMTHTGEKPFACSECGHRFIQSVALKAHMKVHAKKQS